MIKKTRIKFVIISVVSLMSLLGILLINLNMTMDKTKHRNLNEKLDVLVDNYENNVISKIINDSDYFIIERDHQGKIIETVFGQQGLSKEEIGNYISKVKALKAKRGEIVDYRFLIKETQYGEIIAFVSTQTENIMLQDLKDKSVKIAVVGTIVIVLFSYILSKSITKPLEIAVEKQKNFVSDASHELRTPLSIIKINSSLLKNKPIDYEHLNEIETQVDRMSELVNELLVLAKLENQTKQIELHEFDLSGTILRSILQVEVLAYENNKEIKYDIEENLIYKGVQKDIMTMMDILMDNAIKHSLSASDIKINFKSQGKDRILTISNQASGMTQEDCLNIFEGFYRLDQSRTNNASGFGIGLSVVKNIVTNHKGTIKAFYNNGLFTIKVIL